MNDNLIQLDQRRHTPSPLQSQARHPSNGEPSAWLDEALVRVLLELDDVKPGA